jgi:hypothetical protein
MAASDFPTEWDDPRYVATLVAVVATGALYVYAAATENSLRTTEITLVLLAILVPASVVYELARRRS